MSGLLGSNYDSSDEENGPSQPNPAQPKPVNAAPDVSTEVWSLFSSPVLVSLTMHRIHHNFK